MEKIYKSDFAEIEFFEEGSYIFCRWLNKKTMSSEEYKEAFGSALDFQSKNTDRVRFFISDIREQGIVSPENRKWLQEVVLPQTVENKMETLAVIFSGNVFQKYYLNHILNSTKKYGIKFKFFNKEEEAIAWAKKQ